MAEGGGLLNRYTVKSCIGGSNPPLSARNLFHKDQFHSATISLGYPQLWTATPKCSPKLGLDFVERGAVILNRARGAMIGLVVPLYSLAGRIFGSAR